MLEAERDRAAGAWTLGRGLALIFDLDGVVVDSMPVHALAWQRYLSGLGISWTDVATRMHGRRNDEIVRDFLGQGAEERVVLAHGAAKERLFREMMRDQLHDRLVPGIADFLARRDGAPMALATNAERANVDFVLDGAGLRRFFRVIIDGSEVRHAKPAPDIYLLAAQKLGAAPADCIVFEDSPVGVAAARAAGARVAGILSHLDALEGVGIAVRDFRSMELETWLAEQRAN